VKYPVTRFKSLAVALKEIEPMVRDPRHLQTGKPLEKIRRHVSARDACELGSYARRPRRSMAASCYFIATLPGGDGIIRDEATEETWQTEHVYVSQHSTGPDAMTLILGAINHKQANGAAYCRGKTLVVFLDTPAAGMWFPNEVAKALPNRHGSSAFPRSTMAVTSTISPCST
jgi:hypothetical protein